MDVNSPAGSAADLANVTLAILAGGAGRRMGQPKAWLQIDGRPILECIHRNLAWPGPTLLVTVAERRHPPAGELFDREVIDPFEGGPLRGVLTAMEHSKTPLTVVMPVDMPGLRAEHLAWLIRFVTERSDLFAAMCERDSVIEPLPICCRRIAAASISEQLKSNDRSLHSLLSRPGFVAAPTPPEWSADVWRNLNRPSDL